MSTRCSIHFTYDAETYANVYRHSDGYPAGILPDLNRFFADVEEQCKDAPRFNDPSYLAAKFVVWQAGKYARRLNPRTFKEEPAPPLAFLGVGVQTEDPGDIAYRYRVDCHVRVNGARPTVSWQRAGESGWRQGPEGDA